MIQGTVVQWLEQARTWLTDQIVQEVPSYLCVCEFDCREPHCNQQKWSNCSKR